MKYLSFLILVLASSSIVRAAPAANSSDVVSLLKLQDDAILRVGEQLTVGAQSLCGKLGKSAGMTVQLRAQYGETFRQAAEKILGVGDLPTITSIATGSAADKAGLAVGDQIEKVGSYRFGSYPPRRNSGDFAPTDVVLNAIEHELSGDNVPIAVLRAGRPLTVPISPRPACRARFDVRAGRSANASSDGTYVQVSSDLMNEARDDDELAVILAHELAHNILQHPQRLRGSSPKPSVKQTEIEADRLSAYLLDVAGYKTSAAESFWGRWGKTHDWGIFAAGTHPGWKSRVATYRAEVMRISRLKRSGLPVAPPPELTPRN